MNVNFKGQILLGIVLSFVLSTKMFGQSSDSVKKFSAFPFPVVYYAPETRFVFGAGGVLTFRPKNGDKNTRPSTVNGGLDYTQNKQFLSYANFSFF